MINVKILKDSLGLDGNRVTTFELEYPRYIHSEMLTHRVYSRNSASSRAIPLNKMIELVMSNPVIPHWTKNQKGMQGGVIDPITKGKATDEWLHALSNAVDSVSKLQELGIHKQNANRLLEPFQHIKTILTGTEFDNLFNLRISPEAQPEFCELATKMKEALDSSTPVPLDFNDVHCPFIEGTVSFYDIDRIFESVALCAQVSYRRENREPETIKRIINMLLTAERLHASPFEHICWIDPTNSAKGNLQGFTQLRHIIESMPKENRSYDGVKNNWEK